MSEIQVAPPTQPNQQPQLIQQVQTFSSPYPLPQQLEAFERFAPGSAKEVIATAQESIRFQQKMQERAVSAAISRDQYNHSTLRWVLVLGLIGAFLLAILNRDAGSYVLLFSLMATLASAFFYSRKDGKPS